jgi:hypothetical protein
MKVLALFASLAFLVSCSHTTNRSQESSNLDVRLRSDLLADVDVDMTKKIQGQARSTRLFWIPIRHPNYFADGVGYDGGGGFLFFGAGMEEETKSAAAYNAVVPNKADVIVAPQYIVKSESVFFGLWKEVTTQVQGYAGRVRSIRQNPRASTQLAAQ